MIFWLAQAVPEVPKVTGETSNLLLFFLIVLALAIVWLARDRIGLETRYSAKLEAMAVAQQAREDTRDEAAAKRCALEIAERDKRIERLEAARDLALKDHTRLILEDRSVALKTLAEAGSVLAEVGELIPLNVAALEKKHA